MGCSKSYVPWKGIIDEERKNFREVDLVDIDPAVEKESLWIRNVDID